MVSAFKKSLSRKQNRLWISAAALGVITVVTLLSVNAFLINAFSKGPTDGPFMADGACPEFRATYKRCEVRFGNRGISTLNSLYETFVGEGAFEIYGFKVESLHGGRFNIIAQSNRGEIKSEIYTDKLVRLGQDRENEAVYLTHQSAYCDTGRIYEHQAVHIGGDISIQDLEFWTERDALRFRLFQNGSPTADVVCQP